MSEGIAIWKRLRGFVLPVALVVFAQAAFMLGDRQSDMLAPPTAAAAAWWHSLTDGLLWQATGHTLTVVCAGLAIGVAIGVPMGALLGLNATANQLAEFSVKSLRPIPSVALIPVALMSFGLGYRMEIAIVAFSSTWPNLIMTRAAVQGIEPRLNEVARVLGFGPLARFTKITLPAALPRMFVGFRLAAAVALIVAVTVEIAANPYGLGFALMDAQQSLRPDLMIAMLCWVGVVGWTFNEALTIAQQRLFGPAAVVDPVL